MRDFSSLMRESFVPVTLVFVLIFMLLLYVQYKSAVDANQVTLIEIEASTPTLSLAGELEEAGAELGKLINTNRTNDPLYLKAQALIDSGKLSEAERVYQDQLNISTSSELLNDLGVLYNKMGENRRALLYLDQAINTTPVFASAYFNRGVVHSANGDYHQAISDYRQLLQKVTAHFEAQYNIGVAYLRLKDYQQATEAFERASQFAAGTRKARALYNKGITLRASGNLDDEARTTFESAIRLKPDYLDARVALASLFPSDQNGQALALQELDKVISLKPSHARAYFHKGLIYNAQGNSRAAINAYRKAIQFSPEYGKARYNLGLLLLSNKQWSEAYQQFEWVLKRNPTHVRSLFNLGKTAYDQKRYELALQHYYNAISLLQGDYPEAYLNIGLVHTAKKEHALATEAYKEALRLRPDYQEAWFNLGLNHMRQAQYQDALATLRKAIDLAPDYYQAWFNLGIVYTRLQQNNEAIESYRQALTIKPDYQTARINLAIRYSEAQQYEDAITLYKAVIEQDNSYARAWFNLGLTYSKTDNHSAAESTFRHLLALDPSDTRTLRLLSTALLNQQKIDEGIQLLKEAVDSEPGNARLHRELGRALRKGGYSKEAREEFAKSRRLTSARTP